MTINNKINNILTLNPHMGGYLNHNKKNYSERRNHGLSLTNLTHCISPSEYYNDYYNNDSFNKINLQLHASSTVSNPYTFNITENKIFSGNCTVAGEKYTINASFIYDESSEDFSYGYSEYNLGSISSTSFKGFPIYAILDDYTYGYSKALIVLWPVSGLKPPSSILVQINNKQITMNLKSIEHGAINYIAEDFIFYDYWETEEDPPDKTFIITLR